MEVKVYSTPTCPYCKMLKQYLDSKSITYQNFDVSVDNEALDQMVKVSGQMGVPVIVVGDEVIVGFEKARIDSLLGI
ncbi:MAG: thioredoxin family protein [Candidatus Omnitrophota bacterium]|nr:MAG: thioredoxin family protein [Candidatus Omnitrophota bacterium]